MQPGSLEAAPANAQRDVLGGDVPAYTRQLTLPVHRTYYAAIAPHCPLGPIALAVSVQLEKS